MIRVLYGSNLSANVWWSPSPATSAWHCSRYISASTGKCHWKNSVGTQEGASHATTTCFGSGVYVFKNRPFSCPCRQRRSQDPEGALLSFFLLPPLIPSSFSSKFSPFFFFLHKICRGASMEAKVVCGAWAPPGSATACPVNSSPWTCLTTIYAHKRHLLGNHRRKTESVYFENV